MSLQHALLGLLSVKPASGYDLTKKFGGELGRYAWQAGHTRIYPELARLVKRGLIEVTQEGPRGRRTYDVTDAGRHELRSWMLNPPAQGVVRNEEVLRMFLLSALEPDDARTVLHRIAQRCAEEATALREIFAKVDRCNRPDGRLAFGRLAGEFGLRQFDAIHTWALWAIDQLDAVSGTTPGATAPVVAGLDEPAFSDV